MKLSNNNGEITIDLEGPLTPVKATVIWFYGVKLTDPVNIPRLTPLVVIYV